MNLYKYIGRTVELIYMDQSNRITQRTVLIHSLRGNYIRTYCYKQQSFRLFRLDGVLAVQLVGHAV